MDQPVQELRGSLVPRWQVFYRAPAKATGLVFVPALWLQNTGTKQTKRLVNGGRYRVLDSLFLLFGFVTQHGLHDLDFSALATVDLGGEVEEFSVLSGAGTVKQVFHHRQRTVVMLDHSAQKQLVKLFVLRVF